MPPFTFLMPVRFSDIDHAGIVYFARFFHFAHLALEEFFRFRVGGRAYADLIDVERIGFPAVETGCKFMAPLTFGDTAEVELEIAKLGRSSIHFRFRVYRGAYVDAMDAEPRGRMGPSPAAENGAGPGAGPGAGMPAEARDMRTLCAEGRYVVAVVDLDEFRAMPIPEALHTIIEPLVTPSFGDQPVD